jgi:ribose transport system substrate-binding protein
MRNSLKSVLFGMVALSSLSVPAFADGYTGAPRTMLFNPALTTCLRDTSKYKKAPPYVIGFSNAGLGDSWRVVMLDEIKQGAEDHKDKISKLIITDAGHDDSKQVSDVQDLVSQGVDLLIVSANTEKALDPVVTRAMRQGIPVVMLDRRISSDNFVTYVNASDPMMGRLWAQWIVEKLHGKAKQVMQAVIAKYGHKIDAVWSAHGLQVPGSIEAFLEAGFKPGEIPMHTTADINGALQDALKYHVPMLEIGDPPAQGRLAIDVAIKVLSGTTVPCVVTVNSQIGLTDGDETPSVHADRAIKDMVVPNGPPDLLITNDLGPTYNPATAHIQYPH